MARVGILEHVSQQQRAEESEEVQRISEADKGATTRETNGDSDGSDEAEPKCLIKEEKKEATMADI
jgi:hypothetical protein